MRTTVLSFSAGAAIAAAATSLTGRARRQRATRKDIEIVMARLCARWETPVRQTALAYAWGIASGVVQPPGELADWPDIAFRLQASHYPAYAIDRFFWEFNEEDWETGIGFVHGLAQGAIVASETLDDYGTHTELTQQLMIRESDLFGTRLTYADFEAYFRGDVLTASRCLLDAANTWHRSMTGDGAESTARH